LNETLLWLFYCVSAAAAFALIYLRRWRITAAMLVGGLISVAGWYLLFLLTEEDKRPEWITLDLSLNACFGLIFAGAGAALAHVLLMRQGQR